MGFLSLVFDEERDASTIPLALGVLKTKSTSTPNEIFERQLLAAWLNFANGAVDLGTLVDTNFDDFPDTAFGTALSDAEAVRLDPLATPTQILAEKDKLESINLMDE